MGGKKARKNFTRNARISRAKYDGKNRLEKVRKHVFYKHMNIVTKNGGKNARKKFFQKHADFASKTTMEKKPQEKVRKHVFYKHTNIVIKK